TVTSAPAGIDCGKTCAHQYLHYHAATLTATPAPRSTFGGWSVSRGTPDRGVVVISGLCPGTGKCHVYASRTTVAVVTATFVAHSVVPHVKGKTVAEAERSIKSHGCLVGKITHAASRTVKKGSVLWQAPKQGKWMLKWTRVNLAVSSGEAAVAGSSPAARGA